MPVGYSPRSFFAVAFSTTGNTTWLLALPRALLLLPASLALAVLEHFDYLDALDTYQLSILMTPFTLLLGLVTAFRLNDSFKKWDRAGQLTLELHQAVRTVVARMCCYLPTDNPAVAESILEIRRLVLLGCVLIKQHVRDDKDFDGLIASGLLLPEEKKHLTETTTVADGPTGDGKKDKYPSKARPVFAFQKASLINHGLMRDKHFTCPHTFWGIETALASLSDILEDSEHLAISLLPLPYAQVTRGLALIFLLVLPVATATALGWLVIPLCFIVNLTYFLIDECSGQMEEPFGTDPNDVALEKTLRRIDKLTASQLCQYLKRPVTNFNLFPESRSTDHSGKLTNRVRQMGHLSETAGVESSTGVLSRSLARASKAVMSSGSPSQKRATATSNPDSPGEPSAQPARVFTIATEDVVVRTAA